MPKHVWWYVGIAAIVLGFVALYFVRRHSNSVVESGSVVGRRFSPAHEETFTSFITVGKIMIPQTHYRWIPNQWFLTIEGLRRDGKIGRYQWQVDQKAFDSLKDGDHYRREP